MFDQDAEEAFDRTQQGPMHHDRLVQLTIGARVFQSKPLGKKEIELHGRELPETAQRVHQLDIDLRPVECCFAHHPLERDVAAAERGLQRPLGHFPLARLARVFGAVVRVPGGQLNFVLVKAEDLKDHQGKVDAGAGFGFHGFRRGKNMGIILRKAAHPQQPVHDAFPTSPAPTTAVRPWGKGADLLNP